MRMRISHLLYWGITCSTALFTWPSVTHGACVISPTAGNDTFTCDSGISAGFTDTGGDNTLNISGTGTIAGSATFGAGIDIVTLLDANSTGMQIDGSLNQGDGDNILQMNNGTITGSVIQGTGRDILQLSGGSLGAVLQGAGVDSFAMSGGTINGDVDQGDGLDDFFMNDGIIFGVFLSGDRATMTGGQIGRVNMLLDNNFFDMQGGTIVSNLVTGFGNDTIWVSGTSYIGGNISVSGGTDLVRITGGTVNGQILASAGEDRLEWIGGGQVNAFILMGNDNDTALVQNLTETKVAPTPLVDGGSGVDTLDLNNSQLGTPERYVNWEVVNLDNNATLSLGGTLTLGDTGTRTGTLNVNGSSALLVSTGIVASFDSAQLATLNNRGLIDMTANSSLATDTLTLNGNYTGDAGGLALQTVLGDDSSASDRLVVNQGAIGGSTAIRVTNLGGLGAATTADGIRVVDAQNGATSSSDAFSLNGIAAAGPYNYYLYRGGVSAGTQDSWFLRSQTPEEGPVTPLPGPGGPELPGATIRPVPFIRQEVSLAKMVYPAAQQVIRNALGTFHERVGEQGRQRETDALHSGWARVYGGSSRQDFAGDLSTSLDSSMRGYQVGAPFFSRTTEAGATQHLSVFVGQNRLKGKVKGVIDGFADRDAGDITLRGTSVGLSATHIGQDDTYVDVVGMHTRLSGNNESERGIKMKTKGHDLALSVEVGKPFAMSRDWKVEPQVQAIWNRTTLDSQNDPFSRVSYDADSQLTVRAGVRASGDYIVQDLPVSPYVRANIWHTPRGKNTVTFNTVDFDTEQKSTTLDLSLGATAMIAQGVNLYGEVSHSQNLDSHALRGTRGTLGVSVAF